MGGASLAKRVAQALLNGVFRVQGHHFTDIFEKEAKPEAGAQARSAPATSPLPTGSGSNEIPQPTYHLNG